MGSPSWHSGATIDTWIELPDSNLSTSGVMETGGEEVIDAWGGGHVVWGGMYVGADFIDATFIVIWGGGHSNYGGNEVYAYGPLEDVPGVARQIRKIRASTSPPPEDEVEDGSGNPAARHTYTTGSYVNDGSRMWLVYMGALYVYSSTTLSFDEAHVYDLEHASPNSSLPWSKPIAHPQNPANITAYDPVQNRIWYREDGVNNVSYYDVATDTHYRNIYASPIGAGGNCGSCIDTDLGIWAWWSSTHGISFYRTNNGVSNGYYVPTTTGTAPTGQGSIIYDPVGGYFVVRLDADGKKLWKLTPPGSSPYEGGNAWTWSSWTPGTGDTPDTGNAQGTFGRFGYSPNADVVGYVLWNNPDGSIYFYKSGASVASASFSPKLSLLGVGR